MILTRQYCLESTGRGADRRALGRVGTVMGALQGDGEGVAALHGSQGSVVAEGLDVADIGVSFEIIVGVNAELLRH